MDNSSTKDPSKVSPAWKKNKRKKERRKMLNAQNGLPSTDQTSIMSTLNISTVDNTSTSNSSEKISDGRFVVVKRARKRKMKPISQGGQQTGLTSISDPSSNQMVEKDAKCEDSEKNPEMSVNVAKNILTVKTPQRCLPSTDQAYIMSTLHVSTVDDGEKHINGGQQTGLTSISDPSSNQMVEKDAKCEDIENPPEMSVNVEKDAKCEDGVNPPEMNVNVAKNILTVKTPQGCMPSADQTYMMSTLNISTVDDASTCNSSEKISDGRFVVVKRARKRKVKPISQGGQQTGLTSISDLSSNQMVEKDAKCEDGENPSEMSVNVGKNILTVKTPQRCLPSTDQTSTMSTLNISTVDDASTCNSSEKISDGRVVVVKRARKRKVKPISQGGQQIGLTSISDPSSNKMVEKDAKCEDGEKPPELSVNGAKNILTVKNPQRCLPSTDQTYIMSTLNISTVDEASTCNSSEKISDGIFVVVKRARKRKVKTISQGGQQTGLTSISDPYSNQMVEKDAKCEDGEKLPEMSVNVAKNGCLATVKEHSFLEVSCPSLERAPVGHSRRKLLILDLNGLLADIVSPPPKDCISEINISRRAIFKRPFCYDFLKFCFERFDVAIWSSRTKKTLGRVVDCLFEDMKDKLLFCWDLSHCTKTRFKTLENKHKVLVFKELRKIWRPQDPILPWKKGDYNESNTLLLDDSPYKALLNPTHTAIFPHSYSYKDRDNNSLGPGGDLRVYLENLAVAESVKKYVEHHPFGQSAINRTSPSWGFYLNVITSLSFTPKENRVAVPTTSVSPA